MSALDLTPAPAAAPASRRVWSHARTEAGLLLRNGEQVLLALVIPAGIVIVGRATGWFGGLDVLAPSVLALAVWSSSFTSLAISTGFERRYGVLERLSCTPLGRGGLLAGKALATTAIVLGQLVVLTGLALVLGWRPNWSPLSVAATLLAVVLAGAAFAGLALALAGRLRAELTLALANLIYVVLLAAGALVVPLDRYPAPLQPVVGLLPTAALGESVRAGAAGLALGWPLLVLLGWLVIATLVVRRLFRWM